MRWNFPFLVLATVFSFHLDAAVQPHSIPRDSARRFRTSGIFEGGTDKQANLEGLRLASHAGYERWVVDFSDEHKTLGGIAPRFQLRYVKADKIPLPDGSVFVRSPARFVFVFRNIARNSLKNSRLKGLARKSRFVKEIILYPPIERGDMAMEFVLNDNVLFEPHQPLEREGRLVLDLKARK